MIALSPPSSQHMITALLLLPVVSILFWLYWYCLPMDPEKKGRWRWMDSLLVLILAFLAERVVGIAMNAEYENAGPMWPELVSAVSAYAVFAIGLASGLALRRLGSQK